MANRRVIRLSQLPERLARENLEDSDWVTFAVLINKITPQSKNNVSSKPSDLQLQHYIVTIFNQLPISQFIHKRNVLNQFFLQGKTFSIWKLNDLHNLDVTISLFLFGTVHADLWKTDTGTVIGILNPNQMKNKDGSNEVRQCVLQKITVLGKI